MLLKKVFSAIAIAITLYAFIPYIRLILRKEVQPHVFSWIIWGSTTFIVFLAQLEGNGGLGAWPIGVSGIVTITIAILAFANKRELVITRLDWFFFVTAMSSLPCWYFTSNPLWAVVILTTIDVLGFGPTIRKVYGSPHKESLLFFILFIIRNFIAIMALETYSVTTVLFPAATGVACILLIFLIVIRKKQVPKPISQ